MKQIKLSKDLKQTKNPLKLKLKLEHSLADSQLSSRGRPGEGVVDEAKVIMAPHFRERLSRIMFGLHHCHSEVGTLSVTPDDERENTVNSRKYDMCTGKNLNIYFCSAIY